MSKEVKHTIGNLSVASTDWTDEYSVNILDENKHLLAKTQHNVYFDAETAAANAQRIVHIWNNWDDQQNLLLKIKTFMESLVDADDPNTDTAQLIKEINLFVNQPQ